MALTRRAVGRRALGGAAWLGAALAAGCGAGGGAPASGVKPVKLDTWHTMGPGPTLDAFTKLTAEHAAAHPGLSFEFTTIPSDNSRRDKLVAAVAAGAPPDVVHETGAPQTAALGGLGELTAFVKRDKSYNSSDIFDGPTSRCEFFGQVYAVPVICDSRAMWFNKTLFQRAGLDVNNPPKTWSDLEQAATRLTVRNGDDYQQIGYIPTYGNVDLYSYIFMNGGEVQRIANGKVELLFNSPQAVEAAEFMARLYDRVGGYPVVEAYRKTFGSAAQSPFYVGQLGMMRNGSWVLGDLTRYSIQSLEYGLAPEPYGPSGKGPATLVGGWNWGLGKNAAHAEEGWGFLSWFSQGPQAVRFAEPQGNMPARKSALNTDYIQKNPGIKFFFESLRYGKPFPEVPWGSRMFTLVNTDTSNAIVSRQKGAKAALDEAVRTIQVDVDTWLAANKDRLPK
jgi:ABC-type glycerol-3-phosphate transport system substrate-binding protein